MTWRTLTSLNDFPPLKREAFLERRDSQRMTTDPNLHELFPSVSLGPKEERYWDPVQRVIANRATYPFLDRFRTIKGTRFCVSIL